MSSVQVGLLRWWTTDADLLSACSEYGSVVDVAFSEEATNGKSRCAPAPVTYTPAHRPRPPGLR